MSLTYRLWKRDDFPAVRNVIWKTWTATYGSFIPEGDLRSFFDNHYSDEALLKQFANPRIKAFVAEKDGVVVAYERTFFNGEERRYYVASLYVVPECQGLGAGKELMWLAAREAKKRKLETVWLGVMVQNTQAVEWYRKLGYQIVEEQPFTMGKTTVPHFIGYVPIRSIEAARKNAPAVSHN
jgi:ribosomal protein S18 acetylase RimI-like enzyme